MKKLIIAGIGAVCSVAAIAQNDIDAMRYSQLTFGGTARFASMAGSMGALGGDISTISFNPAGIAVFRKSEISITPSFYSRSSSSTYIGNNSGDTKLNVNLGNIGLVGTIKLDGENKGGWQSVNIGWGYNRTNNFHNRISIAGDNKTSSLLDNFVASANGHVPADFDLFTTDQAYQAYLFNPAGGTNQYQSVIRNYNAQQKKSVESKGSMGEMFLIFGANYKDKLFLGGSLGIVHAAYSEESKYEEVSNSDSIDGFNSFTYYQTLNSRGSNYFNGINFKLGVIVKPTDWLRLGLSVHTPTKINFKDEYTSSMYSDLDTAKHTTDTVKGKFNYSITTPYRAMFSVGFVIKKIALLNIDYEYVDYSYASLNSHPNVFSDVNTAIRSKYTATGNLRVGGEVRLDPVAFRLGYALYGSPFKTGDNKNATRSSYTAGVGYRYKKIFMDIAYVFSMYSEKNYLYDSPDLMPVSTDYRTSSFMGTIGVKF